MTNIHLRYLSHALALCIQLIPFSTLCHIVVMCSTNSHIYFVKIFAKGGKKNWKRQQGFRIMFELRITSESNETRRLCKQWERGKNIYTTGKGVEIYNNLWYGWDFSLEILRKECTQALKFRFVKKFSGNLY